MPKPKQTTQPVKRKPGRPRKGEEVTPTNSREYARDYMKAKRASGRDIEIPPIVNQDRRDSAEFDLELFLLTYFPERFPKPFSQCHLDLISDIEKTVLNGNMKAFALPRGSGKTTISECAAIWAAVYAHQQFIVLLAASTDMAQQGLLDSIKSSLEHTDLLFEDFPSVLAPIRALEGENKRCIGQTHNGEPTLIQWKKDRVILPRVGDSKTNEIVIHATGILGTVRGLKYTKSDGTVVRPGLVLIDDPQTDESAKSFIQCIKRLRVIVAGVMQMAGPGESISAIMPCTVISSGDMAHTVLDRELHPDWGGTCVKMVNSWSDNHEELWMQEYAEVRKAGLIAEDNGKMAAEFYQKNREAMDKGASVYWEERYNEKKGEISAIQHAYNILLKFGEGVFASEYQNEPLDDYAGEEKPLTIQDIQDKAVEPVERREVPMGLSMLTAFVDCGKGDLHYSVCAFGDYFTGCVIDYGVHSFETKTRKGGFEGQLYSALTKLTSNILQKEYFSSDGTSHKIAQAGIDAGAWGSTVYRFVKGSQYSNILHPCMGQSHEGFQIPRKTPKRSFGDAWYIQKNAERTATIMHNNVDFFKSMLEERWRVPVGGRGSMTIWKRQHPEFCGHMVSEGKTRRTTKKGEEYDKWEPLPGRPNHWYDCVVGCCAIAHYMGIRLDNEDAGVDREKKRVSFAAMAKQKKGE